MARIEMTNELEQSNHVIDSDKVEVGEIESGMMKHGVLDAQSPTDPNEVTMRSFAHLNEKKILPKMDIRLLPMLTLLYLLSYLDRKSTHRPARHLVIIMLTYNQGGNIGNAKIEGLQEDLNLTGDQYNWCLTVFFFTYAAFEVPSNLVIKRLRPSRWLSTIMVAWGLVMTLMGLVQNYHGLLIARIFLGVTEAGLFPGVAVSLQLLVYPILS